MKRKKERLVFVSAKISSSARDRILKMALAQRRTFSAMLRIVLDEALDYIKTGAEG